MISWKIVPLWQRLDACGVVGKQRQ